MKVLKWLGKYLGYVPKGLSSLILVLIGISLFVAILALTITLYLSVPLLIVSSWLLFLGEGKFTGWLKRASYDAGSLHKAVKEIWKSIFE